uniref:Uncharacterized protein n=1 Tax=Anopheles dirus TaxID=7168 RepID=A0A182N0X0_9DIPT
MHDPAGRETIDELLRAQLVVQLPTLLCEIRAAGNILKEARLRRDGALCAATADVPAAIASDMRSAAEAADSKQFFICTQTIKRATGMLQQLEVDIRRELEAAGGGHGRRRWCSYLEQALDLMYALNWELHLVRLATNALYVHGQDGAGPGDQQQQQLQETDGLKDAIARLVAAIATKHFGPSPAPVEQ